MMNSRNWEIEKRDVK
jgi:hypothetical protein